MIEIDHLSNAATSIIKLTKDMIIMNNNMSFSELFRNLMVMILRVIW